MPNLGYQNFGQNLIDNQQYTAISLRLTIGFLNTAGKNITCGPTSGIASAKEKIRPSGVMAKTINHRRNATSGRSYLSSDGATIRYVNHYCIVNDYDSISKDG